MRKLIPLSIFFCAGLLKAQSSQPAVPPQTADSLSLASRQMEMFSRLAQESNDVASRQSAASRAEQIARQQFQTKANRFVALWGDLATRLNEHQTFDVKLAKKVAKAFHELETSEGWPIREQTK